MTDHNDLAARAESGQVVGYFGSPRYHFGKEMVVGEVSRLTYDGALAALAFVKKLTLERGHPGIRLNLASDCTLMQMARSLGARDLGTYQWQIYIPSALAVLRRLGPVFERRIAESTFSGLTRDVRLGLYRQTILLRFVAGALREVTDLGFTGWEEIRIPPLQLVPLVLGYRTLEELHTNYPDADVAPAWRLLTATLFPRVTSFLYTTY